jgi:polysaccharide export outer membrane protein
MTKNKYIQFFLFVFLALAFQSCVSNKNYMLFQQTSKAQIDSSGGVYKIDNPTYQLQVGDILMVNVQAEDDKVSKIFSPAPSGSNPNMGGGSQGGSMLYLSGYTLDKEGFIELPFIGKVNLLGKTIPQAREIVKIELNKYFKIYFLFLQLSEIRFSALGELGRPGKYSILQSQLNIYEAIAFCGDLKPMSNRKKVVLIRQYPEGVKIHHIDLTDANTLKSPFYMIHSNDIIYVEPVKSRVIGNAYDVQTTLSLIAPILNTFLLVVNTYLIINSLK